MESKFILFIKSLILIIVSSGIFTSLPAQLSINPFTFPDLCEGDAIGTVSISVDVSYSGSDDLEWTLSPGTGMTADPTSWLRVNPAMAPSTTIENNNPVGVPDHYGFIIKVKERNGVLDSEVEVEFHVHAYPDNSFTVGGGGSRCDNEPGKSITLSGSEAGMEYVLFLGGSSTGDTIDGTELPFTDVRDAGNYTVQGLSGRTCTRMMSGSASVSVLPSPDETKQVEIENEGHYCDGGTGVEITLESLETGVTYLLEYIADHTTTSNSGTSFGDHTLEGEYQVIAEGTNGCKDTLDNTVEVIKDPLPLDKQLQYDAANDKFYINNSQTGIEYTLYREYNSTTTPVGTEPGNGGQVFWIQSDPGTYTARAVDPLGGPHPLTVCEKQMPGSHVIAGTEPGMDIMFVLDVSGSMGGKADPACTGTGCTPKIEVLRASAKAVCEFLKTWTETTDQDSMGVTLFRTNPIPSNIDGQAKWSFTDTDLDKIIQYIDDPAIVNAQGRTCMGGGILSAMDDMGDNTRDRNIILFTDGIQNEDPEVIKDPVGETDPSLFTLSINSQQLGPGINIYPIGVNSPATYYELLEDIGEKTIGTAYTSYNLTALNTGLAGSVIDILKNNSPQIITRIENKTSGSTTAEVITLDNFKHKIAFLLFEPDTNVIDLDMRILKEGTDFTPYGKLTTAGNAKIFVLELPVTSEGSYVHSGGDWTIEIKGKINEDYILYSIIDDHQLRYTNEITGTERNTGDPINLETNISFKGSPVYENILVKAIVAKPGESLSNLMATRSVKDFTPSSKLRILRKDYWHLRWIRDTCWWEQNLTIPEKRTMLFLTNPEILSLLEPELNGVQLTHSGHGKFTGEFTDTDISGPYQVLFIISGTLPGKGEFQRMEFKSTVRGFGDIDHNNSSTHYVPGCPLLKTPARIVTLPVDVNGNYFGSGNQELIQATIQDQPARIVDNLDGSYTVVLNQPRPDPEHAVSIKIAGKTMFHGTIQEITKSLPKEGKILKRRRFLRLKTQ
jgi:hypothetical protein